MRRCLDKGDVPALDDADSFGVPELVFALLAIAAHLHFPVRGADLFEILDMHDGSGSDDVKVE